MKIRNGFVSNSSSSSFIVEFPKKPESKAELADMMGECCPTNNYHSPSLSSENVVQAVWIMLEEERYSAGFTVSTRFANISYIVDRLFDVNEYSSGEDAKKFEKLCVLFDQCIELAHPDKQGDNPPRMTVEEFVGRHPDICNRDGWIDEYDFDFNESFGRDWSNGLTTEEQEVVYYWISYAIYLANGWTAEVVELPELHWMPKEDKFTVSFEISDESTYWASLEHGNIFRNLPHTRESHH